MDFKNLSSRAARSFAVAGILAAAAALIGILYLAQNDPRVGYALSGGMAAAAATALGAAPVLFSRRISVRAQDTMFGFGAGVMLAACAFSLILPGLEAARALAWVGGSGLLAGSVVGVSILAGAVFLMFMEKITPHEHFIKGREGMDSETARKLQRTWLFVFAVVLHNFPEGLAIGVGYAGNEGMRANALAVGIAVQNMPEGLVVALALLAAGLRPWAAFALGAASGLIEPAAAVCGAAVLGWSVQLLPWGLGFAAGAMLFVISHEIIPESHRKGHEAWATGGLMAGFVLMMVLDTAFV